MSSLISIIIPVYNVFNSLADCLDSVINQSHTNIEIIVIDDGSSDGSERICDAYKQIDNRIKVIHQKNGGLSFARNIGVKEAKGDYIVFVDSDDIIHPRMVEILYDTLVKSESEIALCSYQVVDENFKAFSHRLNISEKYQIYSGRELLRKMYGSRMAIDVVVAWNKIYRRKYLIKYPYPLYKKHEDEFVTYKIFMEIEKCVYIPEKLYYYRQRQGSIMNQGFNIKSLDKILALEERKALFLEKKDMELYLMTLRRYETTITDAILNIEKFYPNEKDTLSKLKIEFLRCWKEEIRKSTMPVKDKLKYIIFIVNKKVYGWLKEYWERSNKY